MTHATTDHPELSPRRLAVMGALRWMLVIAVTALSTSTMLHFWGPGPGQSQSPSAARYWCPMHHQVRADKPGTCPICHMALVEISDEPEHPDTHTSTAHTPDTPDGGDPLTEVVSVTLTLDRVQLGGVSSTPVRALAPDTNFTAPAVVTASERAVAQVHVRAPGFIEEAPIRETGVRVSRGQILATVYLPQALQTQQELLAAPHFLPSTPSPSPSPSSHAQHSLSAPSDLVSAARENLTLLGMSPADIDTVLRTRQPLRAFSLRAPIAGYVTRREVVPGAYVTPETVLYEITDLSRVWVIASVDLTQLPGLHRGMTATFIPDDGPEVSTHVTFIDPIVSLDTRTARARLEISNRNLSLRPGQWGRARFDVNPSTTTPRDASVSRELVVPRDAVIDTGTHRYVFIDRGHGRFDPQSVTLGPRRGEDTVITHGLSLGDRVVSRGAFMIDSESRLRASLTAAPADGGRP